MSLYSLRTILTANLLFTVLFFTAFVKDNEVKSSSRNCQDKMRMEIKVHPKRHHNHHTKNPDTITTLVKKSPKFSVTKPVDKVDSNHAGFYKGYF